MKISNDIKYIGVDDHELDLFEGQYEVELGMAYNSYLIKDEHPAVMDAVEVKFIEKWLSNIEAASDKAPEYLIVQHMEPDHSAGITAFLDKYPDAKVCASQKAFTMLKQFYGRDYSDRQLVIGDGSSLSLGLHELSFITAPMVHWPEVIMSYDSRDKVLFSADAFGKFGANDVEDPEGWACEARRYYFGIVGKYGQQVQAVLKKASALDIETICPLHGPVLDSGLDYYLKTYDTWSSYEPEDKGVTIAYTSVYGHTREAAEMLALELSARGVHVSCHDLARMDMAEAVEDAFRYDRLVLATTTYNNDIFPFMKHFIFDLTERNYQKRRIAFIENGSWAPTAAKNMRALLEGGKELEFAENTVTIKSALNEQSRAMIIALADELAK